MHILYLEDADTDIDLVRRYVKTLNGAQFSFAKTEDDALNQLQTLHPDIFLVDVMVNGKPMYDLIRMAAREVLADHVILLTAKALPSELQFYREIGAEYIIAKPCTADELDSVLLQFA